MAGRSRVTRDAILETAARLISQTGAASLTFQALGDTLGVSKQAIIYWFPSKADLTRELVLPGLRAEADAAVKALTGVTTATQAIEQFVRALVAFHLVDLGRFRLLYASAQFDTQAWQAVELPQIADTVHQTTGRMYGALEQALATAPDFADPVRARITAAAIHAAAIGLLSMLSLADAVHDPLAHAASALTDALVAAMTGRHLRQT